MQRIKCWTVREQFAYGEDEIHYFKEYELAKQFYEHQYNDYISGLTDIRESETDNGICIYDFLGDFEYAISLYGDKVVFYDEKFW